jgi:hypothetical protein
MYRVTTPTHTFTLPLDTSEFSRIQITYNQKDNILVKEYKDGTLPSGMTFDEKDVVLNLTQEETKLFGAGTVGIQVRAKTNGGKSYASDKFNVSVSEVYNEEIL